MRTKISLKELKDHESILLFGMPKIGKSYACASAIERCLAANHDVFLINTDNGVRRTYAQYFKAKFDEVSDRINYYLLTCIDDIEEVVEDIAKRAKPNDLIIIDKITDVWIFAQDKFVQNLCGGKMVDYYEKASRDKAKFGLFSSQQWQYIKCLDNMLIMKLIIQPPCTVIAIASAKDIEIDRLHANLKVLDRFDKVGAKPGGQPELSYNFNTIIYLSERNCQKICTVVGDRGGYVNYPQFTFERDFWGAFMQYRKRGGINHEI